MTAPAKSRDRFPRGKVARGEISIISVRAGLEVTANVGLSGFKEYLQDLKIGLNDMKPILDRYGQYLVEEHIPRQFKLQGSPTPWHRLSPKYAIAKKKQWGNKPILVASGNMKAGFRWKAMPRTLRIINRVMSRQKGRGIPRWVYHQGGTRRMVARPMMQLVNFDRGKLRFFTIEYLFGEEEARKAAASAR